MLDGFFLSDANPAQLLEGSSDAGLVALSVLIAIISASVCLRLAGLAQVTMGAAQQGALLCGSLVLGSGIWAMHFVGMLAFDLCLTVHYDTVLTLISMLPSLLASWVALRILSRPKPSGPALVLGGICFGLGMGAMQMAPLLRYDPLWFTASLRACLRSRCGCVLRCPIACMRCCGGRRKRSMRCRRCSWGLRYRACITPPWAQRALSAHQT